MGFHKLHTRRQSTHTQKKWESNPTEHESFDVFMQTTYNHVILCAFLVRFFLLSIALFVWWFCMCECDYVSGCNVLHTFWLSSILGCITTKQRCRCVLWPCVCVCLSECTCGQNLWTIMTIVSQQLTKALYQVSSLRCSEHEHSANTLTMPDVLMLYPEFRLKTSKTEKWSVIEYSLALSIPLHPGCVCVCVCGFHAFSSSLHKCNNINCFNFLFAFSLMSVVIAMYICIYMNMYV